MPLGTLTTPARIGCRQRVGAEPDQGDISAPRYTHGQLKETGRGKRYSAEGPSLRQGTLDAPDLSQILHAFLGLYFLRAYRVDGC